MHILVKKHNVSEKQLKQLKKREEKNKRNIIQTKTRNISKIKRQNKNLLLNQPTGFS